MAGTNGFGGSMNYAEGESETNDLPPEDDGMGGGDGDTGEDPTVAAVFQSKQMKDLMSKVDQMFDAIMGGGGDQGQQPGMDAPGGEPGMDAPGGDPAMGGAPGGMPNPEEEAAQFHGDRPVKFGEPSMYSLEDDQQQMYSAGAFPGAGNVNVPSFVSHPSSPRKGPSKMNRTPTRPQPRQTRPQHPQANPEVVKLQRQVEAYQRLTDRLVAKNSRADSEKIVRQLEEEGIVFGDTPEEAAKGREEEVVMLSRLNDADRAACVEVMRRRYKRRQADPAHPAFPGVARYARPDASQGEGDEFDPKTPQEAQLYAEALRRHQNNAQEATKYMRSRLNGSRR